MGQSPSPGVGVADAVERGLPCPDAAPLLTLPVGVGHGVGALRRLPPHTGNLISAPEVTTSSVLKLS